METTTIKLHKKTKNELDTIKEDKETYEDTIHRLISTTKKRNLKKELIEAYQSMGKEDLELLAEWDVTSPEIEDE